MRSILEEFAYGNIGPCDKQFNPQGEFGKALALVMSNQERVLAMLNDEQKDWFTRFTEAQAEFNHLTATQNFLHGYKLGLIMTAEAFVDKDKLVSGEQAF